MTGFGFQKWKNIHFQVWLRSGLPLNSRRSRKSYPGNQWFFFSAGKWLMADFMPGKRNIWKVFRQNSCYVCSETFEKMFAMSQDKRKCARNDCKFQRSQLQVSFEATVTAWKPTMGQMHMTNFTKTQEMHPVLFLHLMWTRSGIKYVPSG